jgi:hypothetical protein
MCGLTLGDDVSLHYQVVDVLADCDELHLGLGSLLLLLLHETPDVLREEFWLDSVDHIKEEFLVKNCLVSQIR